MQENQNRLLEQGELALGSLLLHWGATEPQQSAEHRVLLQPFRDQLPIWFQQGGLLGLQALHPLCSLLPTQRRTFRILAVGPAAPLLGIAALSLRVRKAFVYSLPVFESPALQEQADYVVLSTLANDKPDSPVQRVFLGCNGQIPSMDKIAELTPYLLPEGLFVLYGLPAEQLQNCFVDLAKRGLSLRASGRREGLAYLAGSFERTKGFIS